MNNFQILQWDSELFGFNVAKINANFIAIHEFNKLIEELKSKSVKLIYWPVPVNLDVADIAEKHGGTLVDLKTTYYSNIKYSNSGTAEKSNIKTYNPNFPTDDLYNIALQCGEYSRFNIDKNIPSYIFEQLYRTWIEKSVQKEMANDVLVYNIDDKIAGIVTVYIEETKGNIGLIGVDNEYRGKGIGSKLIKGALEYFSAAGCDHVEVVTQGTNKPACSLYEKNGFLVKEQLKFYHFWI